VSSYSHYLANWETQQELANTGDVLRGPGTQKPMVNITLFTIGSTTKLIRACK